MQAADPEFLNMGFTEKTRAHRQLSAMFSGALAGLAVDVTLFPIDTLKTRLQSGIGFAQTGGFRSVYSGMPSILIGSAPGSAVFFLTYEQVKLRLRGELKKPKELSLRHHFSHFLAASVGETVACVIRVPTEVVKQRAQSYPSSSSGEVLRRILEREGIRGVFRGFRATLLREIPFSAIEFPLWEYLKHSWSVRRGKQVTAWQGALCGSFAGALAAAVTTPFDVVKTRIMLSQKLYAEQLSIRETFKDIYKDRGARGLFAGCIPRTLWMALGGLIFFGAYESMNHVYEWVVDNRSGGTGNVVRQSKYFMFDYVLRKPFYEIFFAKKSRESIKTFDDAIAQAKEVQKERNEFAERVKLEKLQKEEKLASK